MRDVIERHAALHTQLVDKSKWPPPTRLCPRSAAGFELAQVHVSPTSAALLQEHVGRSFALACELPVRALLLTTTPVAHTLELVFHPIAFDSESVRPLLADLSHAYVSRSAGRRPRWPGPAPQCADYLRVLSTEALHAQGAGSRLETLQVRLNPGLHRRLVSYAAHARASLLMVLHAALAMAMVRCGMGGDVPIATIVPNRREPRVRDLVGPMSNVLLIRLRVSEASCLRDVLADVRNAHLSGYSPSTHAQPESGDDPGHIGAYPISVMLNVGRKSRQHIAVDLPDVRMSVASFAPSTAGCALAFDFVEDRGPDGRCAGIECSVRSCPTRFESRRLKLLLETLYGALGRSAEWTGDPVEPSQPGTVTVQRAPSQRARPRFAWSSLYHGFHPTHDRLIYLWESLLQLRNIGIFDDFADLGGDEALYGTMMQAVAGIYRQRLTVAQPAGTTIAALADELVGRVVPTQVFEAQAGDGACEPIWFVHGDYKGGGLFCVDLCNYLDVSQRFLAMPPRGQNGFDYSVDTMVSEKLEQVLAAQSTGPFYIGGYCLGGYIAYEMARRLSVMHHEVGALILVNCRYPQRPNQGPSFKVDTTFDSDIGPYDWCEYVAAIRRYKPKPYSGKVHLLFSREKPFPGDNPVGEWRSLADDIDVRLIAGGHTTCVTRHVASLAAVMTDCMTIARHRLRQSAL